MTPGEIVSAMQFFGRVAANDEGAAGAIARERELAASDMGYLQELEDTATVAQTVIRRVIEARRQ